ncbi:MAG: SxtJ family membrane protein [Nitrospirales bacterium]
MATAIHQPKRPLPSQLRSFGLLMTGVFFLIALWPLLMHGETMRLWAGLIGVIFGLLGLAWPTSLEPVHRIWMIIGEKLGWVNSRIILGLMFYGIFTPVALMMNLMGKRPIQKGYDPKADTYRVPKQARDPKHMLKPF